MRINRLNTVDNFSTDKIQELTIHHYLTNNNTNINKNSSLSTKNQKTKDYNINNLSDDDYILELHRKLAQKREIRKISEQGVKFLNGRVRCLKEENKKTLAKIDLTRKKTQEKVLALEYNKSRSKEKKDYLKKKEDDLKLQKQKNRLQKFITQTNIINNRENLILKNQYKVQMSKAQKIDNEKKKRANEYNAKIFKKNKIEVIRNQSVIRNQNKKISDLEKKKKLIKDIEKKIILEQQKKKEFDDELIRLTNIENDIMERIIKNNEMQKKLIEDFEKNSNLSGSTTTPGLFMSLNNNNISCINGNEQYDDDYDYEEEIKDL